MEVSELVAFATAFDVAPASLYMERDPEKVALTERVVVDGETASKWVSGVAPLNEANARVYLLEVRRSRRRSTSSSRSGFVLAAP
jgi:hypothetical protein